MPRPHSGFRLSEKHEFCGGYVVVQKLKDYLRLFYATISLVDAVISKFQITVMYWVINTNMRIFHSPLEIILNSAKDGKSNRNHSQLNL